MYEIFEGRGAAEPIAGIYIAEGVCRGEKYSSSPRLFVPVCSPEEPLPSGYVHYSEFFFSVWSKRKKFPFFLLCTYIPGGPGEKIGLKKPQCEKWTKEATEPVSRDAHGTCSDPRRTLHYTGCSL